MAIDKGTLPTKRRAAIIVGQDGKYHVKVEDIFGDPHWILRGDFDRGAPTEPGARCHIERRELTWHVMGDDVLSAEPHAG